MKMNLPKFIQIVRLAIILFLLGTSTSHAVLDFKEIKAVSAGIKEIRLEGQDDFILPPGADGQLVAETTPANLKDKVRWEITEKAAELDLQLNNTTGLLTVSEDSGTGWVTVEASAEGCQPKTQRIEIGCGCDEEAGICDSTVSAGDVANGSVDVRLSLGKVAEGRSAGDLFLYAEEPLTILSTPEALVINSASDQVTPFYRDGLLEQIVTPQAIVNFIRFSALKYEVHFFDIGFRGKKLEDGAYSLDPTAVPMAVWRIENPDDTGETINELIVTEIREGQEREFYYTYEASEHNWALISGNGLKIESKAESANNAGDRVVRTEIAGPDGNPLRVEETVYHEFEFGEKRIREIIDPEGTELTTEYHYQTSQGPGYGKLIARIDPDGSWVRYSYDEEGRTIREARPFLDAGMDAAEDETVVVDKSYAPVEKADSDAERDRHSPRRVIETIRGIETARTYYAYIRHEDGSRTEILELCTRQGSPYGNPANLRTETTYYPSGGQDPEAGKIKSRISEAGLLTRYAYEKGRFELAMDPAKYRFIPGKGDARRTTVTHGTEEHPEGIPYKTTRETIIFDAMGREKMRETYAKTVDGFARIDWQFNTHDRLGRVIETLQANGTRTESEWGCCGKISETDAEGITTRYIHDDLKRVTSRTNEATGVVTTFTYDAAGHRLSSTQSNEVLSLTQESRYDRAGKLAVQVDAAGLMTRYSENKNVSTTTLPGGATEITTRHLDGSIRSVTGTAVVGRYYRYGVDDDGHQWTQVFIGSEHSPRWEKTTRDILGRVVKVEKPGFSGIETAINTYDAKGRLKRTSPPGRADTLYQYDALGSQVMTGLDVDGDEKLNPASMDRITVSKTGFKKIDDTWWQEDVRSIFANHNQEKETIVSIHRKRLTGWKNHVISEHIAIDVHGNETRTVESLDRFKHTRTETIYYPDSVIPAQTVHVDGRLAAVTSKTGITSNFGYDALGRRIAVTDPRKGVSTIHYDEKGRLSYETDAEGNRTRYEYDPEIGLKIAEYNTMSKATRYAYDARGQLIRTWGDVPYPVEYRYDVYGHKVSMRTFRGGSGWNDDAWPEDAGIGDQTLWHYQPTTGLLLAKEDAQRHRTAYTYGIGGALATRTWARQKDGKPLRTVYSYDPGTGELINIDYSDDTPDIAFIYDRLGRKVRVNDAAGVLRFAYNDKLQLKSEALTGQQTYHINRNYDEFGRTIGFRLDDSYQISYGYDDKGRFTKVGWLIGDKAGDVSYSYLENSDRLSGMENDSGLSVLYDYEPHRDVKTAVTNKFKDRLISRYEYQYDRLSRRINVKNSGDAFEKDGFWLYGYNDRSEVTSASRFEGDDLKNQSRPLSDLERTYRFDSIGNRLKAFEGENESQYRTNGLNQYEKISGPSQNVERLFFDEDGNLIEDDRFRYKWNAENRLVAALPKKVEAGVKGLEFTYDYMGRRIIKEVFVVGAKGNISTSKIRFIYDGWNMIKEIKSRNQFPVDKFYIWGLDLSESIQSAGGVGGLIASLNDSESKVLMYSYNLSGNVGEILDSEGGNILAEYSIDPFGEAIKSNGSYADENPFRFSTKYFDNETTLYYFGYRYYKPKMGSWLSRDPIKERAGNNLYSYLANNPLASYDLLGLVDPVNGTRVHTEFFRWLRSTRSGEFILDQKISKTFTDLTDGRKPDVLHLKKAWIWELKPFHPDGVTSEERNQLKGYIEALKTKCIKPGPPRFVVAREHIYIGEIDDAVYPGHTLKIYVSPAYENGFLTYTLENEEIDDEFWENIKEVTPEDIPWWYWLLIPILLPTGALS